LEHKLRVEDKTVGVFALCRRYAATILRPYELRYEPLTQSVIVLDNKEALTTISDDVKHQLTTLHRALSRVDHLSIPSP